MLAHLHCRNGGTRTRDPLAPNQVRYRLRYIPLLAGVLLGPRSPLLIGRGAHRMRPTIRKVISNRSATSLWLRVERWCVVWGLFDERTKQNTQYSVICSSRVRSDSYPTLRQLIHPLHLARQARVPNHPALFSCLVVPSVGVEPTRPCGHLILSQARLPVSPRGDD